ncbi:MAG TPA: Re/Si-specific NAD(P)(+) transhydrogenase subunit alpha [Gemmatimonadaceae bacterium]|nr:Re/Si-specific NAD(P)(+) transhydrogenase subunit alpha [Gemmatimonadaceae bacterium]
MRIGVPKESAPDERRVALIPESAAKLVKAGAQVVVAPSAGTEAGFLDAAYTSAGAEVAGDPAAPFQSDIVVKVRPPTPSEVALLRPGTLLISLLGSAVSEELLKSLSERRVTAMALERVPRITRAQSMDVLSSQSTVSGYKAVLLGAASLDRFLPMLTTAAGSITPSKVFVIGAGVAGLQAIATARRLGGVVSAFDVRQAAKEQVLSLGATFVGGDLVSATAEDKGGYAKSQGEAERERTLAAIAAHIPSQDLVITTALIPGKPAPRLITAEMIRSMKPGSVIVDLAAEAGGNSELTRPGETVRANGVTIIGVTNLASTVPLHASQMFSKNVLTLLQHLIKDNAFAVNLEDEITKAMVVTHNGTTP